MATRVVVTKGLCTTKTLKQRVCGQHHVFNLLNTVIMAPGYRSDVLHYTLRSLRLPGSRLSRNDDALVVVVCLHIVVGGFGDGKDMWRDFEPVLALVFVKDIIRVDTKICGARYLWRV